MGGPDLSRRALLGGAGAAVLAGGLAGCEYPRDPDHTLRRVRDEQRLRVGVAANAPWTLVGPRAVGDRTPVATADGLPLAGLEVALADDFARFLGARATWLVDGEQALVHALELGQLDLVVAGLTTSTPWSSVMGLTRPYTSAPDPLGKERDHVLGVPLGENAFVAALERYLDGLPAEQKEPGR